MLYESNYEDVYLNLWFELKRQTEKKIEDIEWSHENNWKVLACLFATIGAESWGLIELRE